MAKRADRGRSGRTEGEAGGQRAKRADRGRSGRTEGEAGGQRAKRADRGRSGRTEGEAGGQRAKRADRGRSGRTEGEAGGQRAKRADRDEGGGQRVTDTEITHQQVYQTNRNQLDTMVECMTNIVEDNSMPDRVGHLASDNNHTTCDHHPLIMDLVASPDVR